MVDIVNCRLCGEAVYDDPPSRKAHALEKHPSGCVHRWPSPCEVCADLNEATPPHEAMRRAT